MATRYGEVDWEHMFKLFQEYSGTKVDFCREQGISVDQFYYYRKKHGLINKSSCTINRTTEKYENVSNGFVKLGTNPSINNKNHSAIKIDIGKATLYIEDYIDERAFSIIVKVLAESC
jgi:hypothetical protein